MVQTSEMYLGIVDVLKVEDVAICKDTSGKYLKIFSYI